jgi:glucose/arabinose dehydrogenase
MKIKLTLLVALAVGVTTLAQRPVVTAADVLAKATLPPGFHLSVFAEGVASARGMAVGAKGTVFVGSMDARTVYALVDASGKHTNATVKVIATGLLKPTGVAFHDGSLYVAAQTKIVRFDNIEANLDNPPAPVTVIDKLPAMHHDWKFLAFGPDGWLYVSDGSPCNVCENADPRFSSILRLKPDGTNLEVFANGVRNSVGFDWDPITHNLWFTDNGRDDLGNDIPNDELNVATKAGEHFGFPYCHQGNISDPTFGAKRPCSEFTPPAQFMGPHVAAIGMRFYAGSMFPASYKNAIFIAQHGSWNKVDAPSGYRVMVAHVSGAKVTSFEPFIEGFMQGVRGVARGSSLNGNALARPADVQPLRDGSLLVSDDQGGRVFRVTYSK